MAKPNSHLCCIAIFLSLIALTTCEQSTLIRQDGDIPPPAWCVATDAATDQQLQEFIDFSCGGKIDCHLIQPGEACYEPNTPKNHGSWCLDSYFRVFKDCKPIGTLVFKDPSYGDCLYI